MTMFYKQDETSPLQPGDVVKARMPGVRGVRGIIQFVATVKSVSQDGLSVVVVVRNRRIKVARKFLRKYYYGN